VAELDVAGTALRSRSSEILAARMKRHAKRCAMVTSVRGSCLAGVCALAWALAACSSSQRNFSTGSGGSGSAAGGSAGRGSAGRGSAAGGSAETTSGSGGMAPDASCGECATGEAECLEGAIRQCRQATPGCMVWSDPTPCPEGQCANAAACTTCSDQCEMGDSVCENGSTRSCQLGSSKCMEWSLPVACGTNTCDADGKKCLTCSNECALGEASCKLDGQLRQCGADATTGCRTFGAATQCAAKTCASTASCITCNHKCDVGASKCDSTSGALSSCEVDAQGCRDWGAAKACATTGKCSSATACLVCANTCTLGMKSCTGSGQLKECISVNGCPDWGNASTCSTNTCASSTACFECTNTCTQDGAVSCQGSALQKCKKDATGCFGLSTTQTCGSDTPVCDAMGSRCACNASGVTCPSSTTQRQCTSGAWATATCSGSKPACVDGVGCSACTNHAQCPTSACHLSGSKAGSCFAASAVVTVTTAKALSDGIASVAANTEKVFRLQAGSYAFTDSMTIAPGSEVAIVGVGSVTITGGPSNDPRNALLVVDSGATAYVASVLLSGTGSCTAILSRSSSTVWVDDSRDFGFHSPISGVGEIHVRRSSMNASGASPYFQIGSFFAENSSFGPNGSGGLSFAGLTFDNSVTVNLKYVTVAGNQNAINCVNAVPPVGGVISNSILTSWAGESVTGGTNGSNCTGMTFSHNAVSGSSSTQGAFGTTMAWDNANWFTSEANGDFHLSTVGKTAIPKSAVRAPDDPALDIDGTSHPASNGYPGYDEP